MRKLDTDADRATPAERVAEACARWGEAEVVRRCVSLLRLSPDLVPTGDDLELAMVLGGRPDEKWIAGGRDGAHRYWPRVWAARALRYVWNDSASAAVLDALGDDHWRVRETASKLVRDHEIGEAADVLVDLLGDDTPRVRVAAVRALGEIGEGEHADAMRELRTDGEESVAAAAASALRTLSRRLDRPL